jgi:hypothetical protein
MPYKRTRFAALLLKEEVSPGTFLAPSAATDGILIERPQLRFDIAKIPTDEVSGSIFRRADIKGGIKSMMTLSGYLKGSGVAGGIPQWDLLARLGAWARVQTQVPLAGVTFAIANGGTRITDSGAGMAALTVGTPFAVETPTQKGEGVVTVSAAGQIDFLPLNGTALQNEVAGGAFTIRYGVAGVAASAGSGFTATAAAPWSSTAQAYRGMPIVLSGNPATPKTGLITDYTAGRVVSVNEIHAPILSAATKLGIPANLRYALGSQAVPSASGELYLDGLRIQFVGQRSIFRLRFTSGNVVRFEAELAGLFFNKADAAMVVPTYDATRPPVWRASRFGIDRVAAALATMGFDPGTRMVFPDDPNKSEGFDVPEIVDGQMSGSIDPYMTSVATRDLWGKLRADQTVLLDAMVTGGAAGIGNRIGHTVPQGVLQGNDPGDRDGLLVENTTYQCDGEEPGAQFCVW